MFNAYQRTTVGGLLVAAAIASLAVGLDAQGVKIADPTSVVMIVNRDSNDIAFMDIKSKKMVGSVFLGNNVNPHMVMMSPDGRYVVTGGTRANKAFIIDTKTLQLVKVDPDRHRAGTPRVLARQPLVLPGEPGWRLGLGDRHAVAEQGQDDSRLRRAAERHVPAGRIEGLRRQLRRALAGRDRRAPSRADQEDSARRGAGCRQARSGQVPRRDSRHQHRGAVDRRHAISTPPTARSASSASSTRARTR